MGSGPDAQAAGLAPSIAIGAAAEGARVELIGKVGDDPVGDAVLLALARQRVGHVAILRDPARQTRVVESILDEAVDAVAETADASPASSPADDPPLLDAADAGLALHYLPEIAVIVAVHLPPEVLAEVILAAGWASTSLVVIVPEGKEPPADLPKDAVTLAAIDTDESAVGAAIGRYAAELDRGVPLDVAYDSLVATGRL